MDFLCDCLSLSYMRSSHLASGLTCVSSAEIPPQHTHTLMHRNTHCVLLPKVDETVDQTPGCAQLCRSLCTVALDLAVCPHGPDTRLKLNYRLVALGPKRGLFGWPLSEKRAFSHSETGKKMSWDLRKKMPVLKTFSYFWLWALEPVVP